MKLVRLATVHLSSLSAKWRSWTMRLDPVSISASPVGKPPPAEGKERILLFAEIQLTNLPTVAEDGLLDIPRIERSQCEFAIYTAANIVSVAVGSARSIASPMPPTVALIPETEAERVRLEETRGIRFDPKMLPCPPFPLEMSEGLLSGLQDRLTGLALLAEAYSFSNGHPSGRFREYIRLFELAFARSTSEMEKKLTQFLQGAELGYDRQEIASWLALRHPSAHADGKKQQSFTVDGTFIPIISRMQQAAIDVLLNKLEWHSPSPTRRRLWKPQVATTSKIGSLAIVQGGVVPFGFQFLDPYGVFLMEPFSLEKPPPTWWTKWAQSKQTLAKPKSEQPSDSTSV